MSLQEFKAKFNYDKKNPLRKPYEQQGGIYNAYFKGYDVQQKCNVLISEYSSPKPQQTLSLKKRIQKMMQVKHKNLVQIYSICVVQQGKMLILALQWCQGGSMWDYTEKETSLDWRLSVRIIHQILQGIIALHQKGIVHRFINLQNVVVNSQGIPKLSLNCLIFKSMYLSPQQKKSLQKSTNNDIFSLGILLYRLIYGFTPFKGKNLQQFTKQVKQGPNYHIQASNIIFPIVAPKQVQEIINDFTNINPQIRISGIQKLRNFNNYKNIQLKYHKEIFTKAATNKYISIMKNYQSAEESNITVLNNKDKTVQKILIFKSNPETINQFFNQTLSKFIQSNNPSLVKVKQHQVSINQLILFVNYDNQGSLKDYRQCISKFSIQTVTRLNNDLKNLFSLWGNQYNYLTNKSIVIHNGLYLLKVPQFPTQEFKKFLRDQKKYQRISFIAPEIIQGKPSFNADTWSIGVIQYWMRFDRMPAFDIHGLLVIPNRDSMTPQQIKSLTELVQKDAKNRKNVIQPKIILGFDQQDNIEQNFGNQGDRKKSQIIGGRKRLDRKVSLSPNKKGYPPLEVTHKQSKKEVNNQIKKDTFRSNLDSTVKNQSQFRKDKKQSDIIELQLVERNTGKNNQKNNEINAVKNAYMNAQRQRKQQQYNRLPLNAKIANQFSSLKFLQKSWSKPIRIAIKCIIGLLLYFFLFYLALFRIDGALISQRFNYSTLTVHLRAFSTDTLPQINYTLVTKTPVQTNQSLYNATLASVRDNLVCVLNDYSVQSNIVGIINRPGFTTYQVFGILIGIANLAFICVILSKLDIAKAFSLAKFEQNNYTSFISFIFVQLAEASLTSCTYLIYGGLFHLQTSVCIRKPLLPSLQYLFKDWLDSFGFRYSWIYIGVAICYAVIIYFILRPNKKLHIIFYLVLICLYLSGIGVRAMGGFVSGSIQSIIGVCGELLVLMSGIIYIIVDLIFGCVINTKKKSQENDDQKSKQKMNKTEQFMFGQDQEIDDEFK